MRRHKMVMGTALTMIVIAQLTAAPVAAGAAAVGTIGQGFFTAGPTSVRTCHDDGTVDDPSSPGSPGPGVRDYVAEYYTYELEASAQGAKGSTVDALGTGLASWDMRLCGTLTSADGMSGARCSDLGSSDGRGTLRDRANSSWTYQLSDVRWVVPDDDGLLLHTSTGTTFTAYPLTLEGGYLRIETGESGRFHASVRLRPTIFHLSQACGYATGWAAQAWAEPLAFTLEPA